MGKTCGTKRIGQKYIQLRRKKKPFAWDHMEHRGVCGR